jgi:IS5 family transposase
MRLGHDLLASSQGMARGRRVGRAASNLAGSAGQGRRDRLGEGLVGLGERTHPRGGQKTGKNPTDKGKSGSKRHLVVDRSGIPLSVTHSAANVHDSKVLEEAVDAIEPIHKPRGRPRKRPNKLHADKAYDFPRCREAF